MERRLSAIFAADMVGYSRLMEADEVGTLQRQKTHRTEFINPTFEEFHGRIVKEMGDGILIEFPSVVEAVQCAVVIQQGMVDRDEQRRGVGHRSPLEGRPPAGEPLDRDSFSPLGPGPGADFARQ